MRVGDMVQPENGAFWMAGLIIETPPHPVEEYQDPPDILVLWNDGALEYCDPLALETINASR